MSKRNEGFKPLSLAQHFDAPDEYVGCFGWLCGYSADADFLNNAAERFMRQTKSQRASGLRHGLSVMLHANNAQITPIEIPGVIHHLLKSNRNSPFNLLHAKVALLGFYEKYTARWQLRLIVSTGNWTCQTLDESLDLAWRVDLHSRDLEESTPETKQICADIKAAWDLMRWLTQFFDLRILSVHSKREESTQTMQDCQQLESWLNIAIDAAGEEPSRFFDSRKASLLEQLPALVEATGPTTSRNYLAMGSGFYQSVKNDQSEDALPSVLDKIVETLRGNTESKKKLLTIRNEIDLFVNPDNCPAVAQQQKAIEDKGWTIRPCGQPGFFPSDPARTLHAKFVFSANYRTSSVNCNNAWIYLGSGNLTIAGFDRKASQNGGNLEAGVVFAPSVQLKWESGDNVSSEEVVTNILPIQYIKKVGVLQISSPDDQEVTEPEMEFLAPPIACFQWYEGVSGKDGWLEPDDGGNIGIGENSSEKSDDPHVIAETVRKSAVEQNIPEFEVLDGAGHVCLKNDEGRFFWSGQQPRQIEVKWIEQDEYHAMVPVVDEFGRVAASHLEELDLVSAWWELADFPHPPENKTDDGNEDSPNENGGDGGYGANDPDQKRSANSGEGASHGVRRMMELIENIATKQTSLAEADWNAWLIRLRMCLTQAANSPEVCKFLDLKLNPLGPLWQRPFRPDFAETGESKAGQSYEQVLLDVEEKWGMVKMERLGGE